MIEQRHLIVRTRGLKGFLSPAHAGARTPPAYPPALQAANAVCKICRPTHHSRHFLGSWASQVRHMRAGRSPEHSTHVTPPASAGAAPWLTYGVRRVGETTAG